MALPPREILIATQFKAFKELDGEADIKQLDKKVASLLHLNEEETSEIHEGNRTKLSYELAWCRFYMRKAGLIDKLSRGKWILTVNGYEPSSIDGSHIISNYELLNDFEIENEVINDLDDSIPRENENSGVEKELNDDPIENVEPFDPKQIDIKDKRMMLKALFDRLNFNEIDLFTDFQRQGDLWDITKQSRLIESILIRFPLPTFYFDGSDDNLWLIVDGLQRISALKNFVIDKRFKNEPFRLVNLEFLKTVENCTYDELPRDLKRRIDETEINIYIISPGTPEKVKYNLFRRINTSGLILEPQEIRHALNQGIPALFVKDLASLEEFKKATGYAIKTNRMLDRDFITRYVSFYLVGFQSYEPDLDSFLNRGMAKIKLISESERIKLKEDFQKAMKAAYSLFGKYAFRKRYKIEDNRKPINKALFEIWSVALAKTHQEKIDRLISNAPTVNEKFINLLNNDKYFEASITSSTGDKKKVAKRFSEIEQLINTI